MEAGRGLAEAAEAHAGSKQHRHHSSRRPVTSPYGRQPPLLTRNLRQKSSMELISRPCTCLKAALYWTSRREQAAVYLGRGGQGRS